MTAETQNQRLHALIEGRVQGVGFRYFVIRMADEKGLQGWVRNRHNGKVEVLAEGPFLALESLLQALRRGPSVGLVRNVTYEWSVASGEFTSFSVRGTV